MMLVCLRDTTGMYITGWLHAGGRVTGAEVIAEMVTELFSSAEMGAQFEGDMRRLASYAR